MESTKSKFFNLLPWMIVFCTIIYLYSRWKADRNAGNQQIITSNTLLQSIETLGKLELVKYNFQKITEVKELGKEYWQMIKVDGDSKIVLISQGEAVACVDLTKINLEEIKLTKDSVEIILPEPELCYYKLDLSKTRVYALQTGLFIDKKEFIQKAYSQAEKEIRDDAINSGIMQNASAMSQKILKPFLEKVSGRKVIIKHRSDPKYSGNINLSN